MIPTADRQLAFMANLQRLLAEGSSSSTYKHAMLLALADLSVELGDDSGAPLALPISVIAERIVIYYWRQVLPYPCIDSAASVLKQNTGRQAAILRLIGDVRSKCGGSLAAAKAMRGSWARLVADVAGIVKVMPLWKLQRVGDCALNFPYPATQGRTASIELRPGVAFCFRRFHGLVQDLVRGAWVRFVRDLRDNQAILGEIANLDEFLFGSERSDLAAYRPILYALQAGPMFLLPRQARRRPCC